MYMPRLTIRLIIAARRAETVDENGMLADINVQPITKSQPSRSEGRKDVDYFFEPPKMMTVDGETKKRAQCKQCK